MGPSDQELVARVVALRDPDAFGQLVQRYQSQVRGWLRQLTHDPMLADDLAQDTFIRAWDKLHTFAGTGRFSAWLMKLAYSMFLQFQRKSKSNQRLLERLRLEQAASEFDGDEAWGSQNNEWPDLPRFMNILNPEEMTVLVLNYAYGLSHREIGEVIDMPVGTIKSHIRRGKDRIRDHFGLAEVVNE